MTTSWCGSIWVTSALWTSRKQLGKVNHLSTESAAAHPAEEIQALYTALCKDQFYPQDPAVVFATLSDVLARFTASDGLSAETPTAKTLAQMAGILTHAAIFSEGAERAPSSLHRAWGAIDEVDWAIESGHEMTQQAMAKADNQPTPKRRLRW